MKKQLLVLAIASCVLTLQASEFADAIIGYDSGVGFVAGFTNPLVTLGEPSPVNPFGEPTDPFDPPYGKDQIISIGEGGSLTVQFKTPIVNHPNNLYGLDFTIFGNAGFIITNDFDFTTFQWIGTPATDSSLFGQSSGATRVSVSRDGIRYFALNPNFAPTLDGLFPTDGSGDPHVPIAPNITQQDFGGQTLDGIRGLYAKSAGGASFDISWAQDDAGNRVFLPEINFVRVDVLSGKIEIDAFATVVRQAPTPRR